MNSWFETFTGVQKVFACCAVIGGVLFLVQLFLAFLGMGDHDVDHADIDDSDVGHEHSDSDAAFKLLSFQGMMAFLLSFGLFGLAASRDSRLSNSLSSLIAVTAGVGTVWLVNKMFRFFGKLQHAGNIDMANAIGEVGLVYSRITPEENGKVTVTVQNRLLTLDAMATDSYSITTGTRVRVCAVVSGRVLVVEPTEQLRNEKEQHNGV